jgi:hypothetical protein
MYKKIYDDIYDKIIRFVMECNSVVYICLESEILIFISINKPNLSTSKGHLHIYYHYYI